MEKSGKIWGETSPIFSRNNVEIHRIFGKKGGRCSKHKHEHKFNMFFLESGEMEIKVWKNDYDLVDSTILKNTGDQSIVKPGEYHQFIVLEDCICFEIYWTQLNCSDIVREECGKLEDTE